MENKILATGVAIFLLVLLATVVVNSTVAISILTSINPIGALAAACAAAIGLMWFVKTSR